MKKAYLFFLLIGAALWSCSPESPSQPEYDDASLFGGGDVGGVGEETDNQTDTDESDDYGVIYTSTLYAGQTIPAGIVNVVANPDTSTVDVEYNTTGDWVAIEYHVYIGSYADLPRNNAGKPKIGHFPISDEYVSPETGDYIAGINYAPGDCNFVAVHIVVQNTVTGQEETAWMYGVTPVDDDANQSGWAMGSFVPEGCSN